MYNLSQCKVSQEVSILAIPLKMREQFIRFGIVPGAKLKIIAKSFGTISVCMGGQQIAIGKPLADLIIVKN